MSDCWSERTLKQEDVGREKHKNTTRPDSIDPCASCSGDWEEEISFQGSLTERICGFSSSNPVFSWDWLLLVKVRREVGEPVDATVEDMLIVFQLQYWQCCGVFVIQLEIKGVEKVVWPEILVKFGEV